MKRFLRSALVVSLVVGCDKLPVEPDNSKVSDESSITAHAPSIITFAKRYGSGDFRGLSLVSTFDGGYAILGENELTPQVYIFKTDRYGNLQWQNTYGTFDFTHIGRQIRQTPDSGFVIIGSSWIIKVTKTGTEQWEKEITDIETRSIALSSDNGYVLTGSIFDTSTALAVVKLSSLGDVLWVKKYPVPYYSAGESIERTTGNGFIIAGTYNNASDANLYLVKIDAQGTLQWQGNWGGNLNDYGVHAIQTSDGGYLCLGTKENAGTGNRQIYLVKVDAQGGYKWIKGYFPSNYTKAFRVCESTNGYAIAGVLYGEYSLLKVSRTGSYSWSKEFPECDLDIISDLVAVSDGGYALTGRSVDSTHMYGVALVKTDANGNY